MLTWDEAVGFSYLFSGSGNAEDRNSYESSVTVRTKEEVVVSLITNGDTTADSMLRKSICFCISSSNFVCICIFICVFIRKKRSLV